jgi:hypothetical protein
MLERKTNRRWDDRRLVQDARGAGKDACFGYRGSTSRSRSAKVFSSKQTAGSGIVGSVGPGVLMAIKLVALLARRSDFSHEAFVERYETVHVPLIRRLLPPFSDYRRSYVDDEGSRAKIGWDVITEAWFEETPAYDAVLKAMVDPAIAGAIAEDEAKFIDRDRMITFAVDERR